MKCKIESQKLFLKKEITLCKNHELSVTWSELEPEDEFLVLVEEEIDENVVSLWVEMFLVLGFAGDEITLDALDERRDLIEVVTTSILCES